MSKSNLPENFWEEIEANLPNYDSRDDVLENDLMNRYVDGELEDENDIARVESGCPKGMAKMKWVKSCLAKSNESLYNEAINAKRLSTFRMIIACTNSNGDSDLAFVKVTAKSDEVARKLAKKWAKANDYGAPFVVFNGEVDTAGIAMLDLITWETASVCSE